MKDIIDDYVKFGALDNMSQKEHRLIFIRQLL